MLSAATCMRLQEQAVFILNVSSYLQTETLLKICTLNFELLNSLRNIVHM